MKWKKGGAVYIRKYYLISMRISILCPTSFPIFIEHMDIKIIKSIVGREDNDKETMFTIYYWIYHISSDTSGIEFILKEPEYFTKILCELVKNTIRLEREELLSAPSISKQLTSISVALAADPALRLGRLDWSIQSPLLASCPTDPAIAPATAVAPNSPASDAAARAPGSRISFDLVLPPTLTGKARTSVISAVSERLASIPGVALQLDPAKLQPESSLAGGSRPAGTEPATVAWCLDMSNVSPSLAPSQRSKP